MAFTLDEFKDELAKLGNGQQFGLPYDVFGDLFPPGIEDDGAKEKAWSFAKENRCAINNRPTEEKVWFIRLP